MLYLLWTLFNFALALSLLALGFRTLKTFRERIGIGGSVLVVIGLLAFMNRDINSPNKHHQPADYIFTDTTELQTATENLNSTTLAHYPASTAFLDVSFSRSKHTGHPIPTKANLTVMGLVGGHEWTVEHVTLTPLAEAGKFDCWVRANLKWCLLGVPVFQQTTIFAPTLTLK